MAVMDRMRQNTQIILFILLILFLASMTIGGLVGGADIVDLITGKHPDAVAEINGQNIPYKQYYDIYQKELEAYRNRTGSEPEGYQLETLENQIWEGIVQRVLLDQVLKKRKLRATDDEVVFQIYNNPPEIIRSNENFVTADGSFDQAKYQAALNDPGTDWRPLEEYLRYLIPQQKLQQQIFFTVRVTDEEVKAEYIKKNVKVKVKYLFFDPNKYRKVEIPIDEKDVKKYHEEHKEEFKEPEKRKIDYVLFETKPSTKDSAEVWKKAEELLKRARQGEDFGELAQTFSDDPGSGAKGGDLGYFGRGAMVKPFEEAAFNAQVGQIVGPIPSPFGLHIIKVEDKKKEDGEEKVKARHILLKFEASRNTIDQAWEFANYFAERAPEEGFEQVAQVESLTIQTTDFFTAGGFIPGIGMESLASRFIFSKDVGTISRAFETSKGICIFKIVEIQKERIKPLKEVELQIKNILQQNKRQEMAGEWCQKVYKKIKGGIPFETAAEQDSLEIKETDYFNLTGYVSGGVGRDARFIGTAFALKEGEISAPVEGVRGYYLIKLIEKQPFDESKFEAVKESLRYDLLKEKRQKVFIKWHENLKHQADIKDYRSQFFF